MWLGEGYEVRSLHRSKEGSDVSGSPNPDIQAASVRVLPHPIFFLEQSWQWQDTSRPSGTHAVRDADRIRIGRAS